MTDTQTKIKLRASSKLACQIAGVHQGRFNEAVHFGFYPCAPETIPGRARSFDVDDVVALMIYQHGMRTGLSAKAAGHKACVVRKFMRKHPDAPRAYLVTGSFATVEIVADDFDMTTEFLPMGSDYQDPICSVEVVNLDWRRKLAVAEITDKARKVRG
ncbi:MAG: hypothetical protein JJU42_08140 [Rhodobacteraceae bacterium]|nr:hypothetical protein [Paracoccaceae bacterium]